MNANDLLPLGTVLKGEYRIESLLGRSGLGLSYRATRLATREPVVIKECFPDGLAQHTPEGYVMPNSGCEDAFVHLKQRFRRASELISNVRHPGGPRWLDAWDEGGTSYLALEFAQGVTLEERLKRGPLPEAEAKAMLVVLLGTLEALHAQQLLHGDIEPTNIVFTPNGPRLIDFGSAFSFEPGIQVHQRPNLLTPQYAPPEQFGTEVRLEPATDLYALAATTFHALTGTAPVSSLERAAGVKFTPIRSLNAKVSPQLAKVLERALELRIDARPPSAKAMTDQLAQASATAPGGARPLFWVGLAGALALTSVALIFGLVTLPGAGSGGRFTCSSHSLKPWMDRSFATQKFDVWLVPMDDEAFETLERVKARLEAHLQIRAVVVPCFSPSSARFDPIRRQFAAEQLIHALHTEYPIDVNIGSSTAIALTSESMYIDSLDWRWAFAYRPDHQFGVVSTSHMRDGLDGITGQSRFEARVRKMLMKNIGILHFKMPQNQNPTSVLYDQLHSVEALDRAQERY